MDAINLVAASIPNAFGAPAAALQPGQVIQALVLELLESGAFRLQLPQATVDVRTSVSLTPGSTVTLAVKGGSGPRLDILAQSEPGQPSVAAPEVAPARPPIGEAVVIARTALPDAKPVTPLTREIAPQAAPSTPLAALGEAVRSAVARQGGLAPLFADLQQALQSPAAALPQPVRAAAEQLLALRLPLDGSVTADGVKQALARSGVLMEAQLAASTSAPASPAAASPETGADLKSALLVLRQALKVWVASAGASPARAADPGLTLGKIEPLTLARPETLSLLDSLEIADPVPSAATPLSARDAEDIAKQLSALLAKAATPTPAAAANSLAPPYRGAPLTPQPPAVPVAAANAAPREVAIRLLAETESALARSTLLQAASLPDTPSPHGESGPRWSFEVPFAMPQGTGIVPFEISRDGRGTAAGEPSAPAWRARFSIDLDPIGPVHALVSLTGDRVSVTLCAERLSTASQLNDGAPMLNEALRAAELQPSDLTVRVGTPRTPGAAPPGRFMDRAS